MPQQERLNRQLNTFALAIGVQCHQYGSWQAVPHSKKEALRKRGRELGISKLEEVYEL